MRHLFCLILGTIWWYSSQAKTVELTAPYGQITSPGYPENYDDGLAETWNIIAPKNYQVVLYFTAFNIENSYDEDLGGACVYDYVEIENSGKSMRFCGNSREFPADAPIPLRKYRSENNTMVIRFVTDYSNDEAHFGFVAHYIVDDKDECAEMAREVRNAHEDWDELVYCNHFCINTPGSYYCSCRHGFVLHENQHTCKASCENQQIVTTEGFIASPDYPQPYSRLTDCDWTITVPQGFSLNLQFSKPFKIEDHPDYDECVYDYLKVDYGSTEAYYCHDIPNNGSIIETNAREVRLEFHTDGSLELAGFNMSFTPIRERCNEARDSPQNGSKPPNAKGFYEFEDEIVFSCNPGYKLVGSRTISCLSNGSWSNPAPVCQIKSCGIPEKLRSVPNSHLKHKKDIHHTYGDVVKVDCNKWYQQTSGFREWRCSENAVWIPTDPGYNIRDIPICNPVCGIKNGKSRPLLGMFIFNGEKSDPHEWPWMAFINIGIARNVGARTGTCTGFLISPDYVLTAAHCVSETNENFSIDGTINADRVHVWLKTKNRLEDYFKLNSSAMHVSVKKVLRHPDYHVQLLDSDIALLQLNQTIVMSDTVRPICLPSKAVDFEALVLGNTSGEVAGWGMSISGSSSYNLHHIELPTVTSEKCWNVFRKIADARNIEIVPRNLVITKNMFCAGYETGALGATCKGDSGGPYMVEAMSTSKYYAHGVVSFGIATEECGENLSYSVFAKLNQNLITWIQQNMK